MKDSRNKKESNTIVAFSRWIAPHTHIPPNKRILFKKNAQSHVRGGYQAFTYTFACERERVFIRI